MNTLDDDEYLWSGKGTPSEDVVALERSLGALRWRPRSLVLPSEQERVSVVKWWPTVVAGLVAAAAVLALLSWSRPKSVSEEKTTAPVIEPTAPPTTSPDLKDPFGSSDPPGFTAPILEPEPPPAVPPTSSPDLKDPFAARDGTPAKREPKRPKQRDGSSPDLKDPFGSRHSEPAPEGELVDPFGGRDDDSPPSSSPDLKDPFGSRSELDAEAEAGEDR